MSSDVANSQWSPEGPNHIAGEFAQAIVDENLRRAFGLMRPELRHRMTAAWVQANAGHPAIINRDADALATELARPGSTDPLWPHFEKVTSGELHEQCAFVEDFDKWGFGGDPRPYGPNRELVVLFKTGGRFGVIATADTPLPGVGFVMEHGAVEGEHVMMGEGDSAIENMWRVAEFSDPDEPLDASR